MKKTGFTLAEVLITLAIIGVVATMTLPALMANTNEQQSKTGLKKVINTLSVAAEMSQANQGYDFGSIATASDANDHNDGTNTSLYALLLTNTKVDTRMIEKHDGTPDEGNYVVFFRDGSSLEFNPDTTTSPATPRMNAVIDINGNKNPNILSNCHGAIVQNGVRMNTSNTPTDFAAGDTDAACDNKTNRVIRDKFSVTLEDSHVLPNGPAARWAYEN